VVLEQGEAHFEVAKNHERAFVVSAGGIEVRAVGTAFSVDHSQAQVEVVVTHGRVAVEKDTGAAKSASVASADLNSIAPIATLDAGHSVVVDLAPQPAVAPQVASLSPAELMERVAWRLPRLEFTDTSMAEAVKLFNRNNRIQLQIFGQELARLRVSGVFRSDNTDGFVHLLETSFGVRATRSADAIVLVKER
jgi:transmembrane sensor